ncbi:MAG: alanine--tRNA ligase-related protein, partial [bacterium]|nr:alanine--tRNA ligase-related protein [bacterium]
EDYRDDKSKSDMRIIADHMKAATFLILDGVIPSNKAHGYVLRRLLRRASVKFASLRNNPGEHLPPDLITTVLKLYDGMYTIHREKQESGAYALVEEEIRKFQKTMHVGLKVLQKMNVVDGQKAFDLYQTYGFPLEVTIELLQQRGKSLEIQDFQREFRKHQELSRKTSAGMFKGGLASHTPTTTKYHTATHLLHQALRDALGSHVVQKGSNITDERLRFDFHHDKAMTDEEVRRVEEIVNQKIKKDLQVTSEKMTVEEAKKAGAIGLFPEKYDKRVTVYSIGDYSKEMCGGPHVSHTGEIGRVKIIKEEPLGSSLRRIRAVLTP